ncbi:MAG: hypothetical protein ABIR57_05205 [Aeromicrobium sp.]
MDESPESPSSVDSPLSERKSPQSRRKLVVSVLAILVGLGLAFAYYTYEGNQRAYDAYGVLPLGSSQIVHLKSGDVRLNYREINTSSKVIGTLAEPKDLAVDVYGPSGSTVKIEKAHGYHFSIVFHRTGHQPFGTFTAHKTGDYTFVISGAGGGTHAPSIAVGKPPLAPFGSVPLGTVLLLLAPVTVVAGLSRARRRT